VSNNLATLNTKLATALRDSDGNTWATTERDDLLTWACTQLWPKVARRLTEDVTIVADQEDYTLTTLYEVDRVDMLDGDDHRVAIVPRWEFLGDGYSAGGTLSVDRGFVQDTSMSFKVHGWGAYDLVTNLPYDRYVPLILAIARAEAGRREITRRMQSKNWRTTNQVQNISANELVLLVNEADAESERLARALKTWRRPRPAFGLR